MTSGACRRARRRDGVWLAPLIAPNEFFNEGDEHVSDLRPVVGADRLQPGRRKQAPKLRIH